MNNDDTYNGWINRETWALHLWLTGDEALYFGIYRPLCEAIQSGESEQWAAEDQLKEQVLDWHAAIADGDLDDVPESARRMIMDIGSIYRVRWADVIRPDE